MSAILDGLRARDPFVLQCAMSEPWSVEIADRAAAALVVVQAGELSIVPRVGPAMRLAGGDAVIITPSEPYRLASTPGTPADVRIEPGQVCRSVSERGAGWPPPAGSTWGNDISGDVRFFVVVYESPRQVTGRLLDDLPQWVMARGDGAVSPLVDLLAAETGRTGSGHDLALDRLADLLVLETLRRWLERSADRAPAWARADSLAGGALRLMHDHPEDPWTLATLAAELGVSRATLARRFSSDVGTPPLTYLTEWRLARAADLLRASSRSVEQVAKAVGYTNPFAFSTAFKRHFGTSPRDHRNSA